ncbi:hypothetical protein TNCV_4931101 [Trichonephila clavipes]|nr:hypothetical protein TNCV_4931101 [Trichonephila clavipes]
MADCEVEGTIASPLSIPLERAMSPTGERRDEARNIRTRQNPFGPQERQTRIDRAKHFNGLIMSFALESSSDVMSDRFMVLNLGQRIGTALELVLQFSLPRLLEDFPPGLT